MSTNDTDFSQVQPEIRKVSPSDIMKDAGEKSRPQEKETTSSTKQQNTSQNKTESTSTVVSTSETSEKTEVKPNAPVKLANAKVEVISPASTTNATVKQPSQSVRFIREYIKKYLDYPKTPGAKNIKTSISLFQNIIIYAMENPQTEVFDEVYTFFKTHRSSVLAPEQALQGIQTLTLSKQERLQQVYMLFYTIVTDGKTPPLDLEYAAKVLKSGNLIAYIESKMR